MRHSLKIISADGEVMAELRDKTKWAFCLWHRNLHSRHVGQNHRSAGGDGDAPWGDRTGCERKCEWEMCAMGLGRVVGGHGYLNQAFGDLT